MANRAQNRQPIRSLMTMLVILLGLFAFLAGTVAWDNGSFTPKLGLDLEGGQQVILKPIVRNGESVNDQELQQAVDIMRARVDGQGVSEADVSTLGDEIAVTVPGRMSTAQQESLQRSSQMRFRPVLTGAPITEPSTGASATPSGSAGSSASTSASAGTGSSAGSGATIAPASPAASAASSAKASVTKNAVAPQALRAPAATGTPSAEASSTSPSASASASAATPAATSAGSAAPSAAGSASASGSAAAAAEPVWKDSYATDYPALAAYATSETWITPAWQQKLAAYDCRNQGSYDPAAEDLKKPTIACDSQAGIKYLLGPAVLLGSEIADASSGQSTTQQGVPTGGYEVRLTIGGDAVSKYYEVSKYMLPLASPRNQLAVVLDNEVVSAPSFNGPIPGGNAQITGNFTQESAKLLADQLKFGALPMSFQFSSSQDVSPTLGTDQLTKGLMAGAVGLLLVIVYSLFQYRALGLVTIASLVLVSLLTYISLALLGWSSLNLRLTMAGITGAIVAIGTTADSFIVYFERVRDEVREGRALRAAVETGWQRAKRTILISDAVNFLAAAVLYLLASSNVRGFAFMLMLTTILDVLVVFLFTHPLLTLLARTTFFGRGHKWSGFDPAHLGTNQVRYAGRGRIAGLNGSGSGRTTVADRKRGATAAAPAGTTPTTDGSAL